MKTNIKPATALPWRVEWAKERVYFYGPSGLVCSSRDSAAGKEYEAIAKRENAYPELVAALRSLLAKESFKPVAIRDAAALLRKLGESA